MKSPRVWKFVERLVVAALLALAIAAIVLLWQRIAGGFVSNREVRQSVVSEAASLKTRLDERCDTVEARLNRIESKIDGLDRKLDRLIELATPRLPDEMRAAE